MWIILKSRSRLTRSTNETHRLSGLKGRRRSTRPNVRRSQSVETWCRWNKYDSEPWSPESGPLIQITEYMGRITRVSTGETKIIVLKPVFIVIIFN